MKFINLYIIILLFSIPVVGQNIEQLENKRSMLQSRIEGETRSLDSLNIILERTSNEIDRIDSKEKSASDIKSSAVVISNQIEVLQQRIDSLDNEMNEVEKKLLKKYQTEIDELEKSKYDNLKKEAKEKIDEKIMILTFKKMEVAPVIASLSIDPQKLLNITPGNVNQEKIIKEYYEAAITEVKGLRKNISEELNEVNKMQNLREESEELMEESGFENLAVNKTAESSPTNDYNYSNEEKIRNNVSSLNNTIEKLNLSGIIEGSISERGIRKQFIENEENYIDLLSDTNYLLEKYERILEKKLNSFE